MTTVKLRSKECPGCGDAADLEVSSEGLALWNGGRGAHIQVAFPELPAGDRERLMTGYCPRCWDELFPEEDDEEFEL